MEQLRMIDKAKELANSNNHISAVLMYGSFIKGEGDKYSDIEFYIFCNHDFNHEEWVNQIHKTKVFFTNEFGTEVAIFDNWIRGEFHFLPIQDINIVQSWEKYISFEYYKNMIIVDKEGKLAEAMIVIDKTRPTHSSKEDIDWICKSLLNNMLMTKGLILRGELAHAHQAFQHIQKYLLFLIRLESNADNHWESPTKKVEKEIPKEWYNSYIQCIPIVDRTTLIQCFDNCIYTLSTFQNVSIPQIMKASFIEIRFND